MNHDKAQDRYGYQEYSMSDNSYKCSDEVVKMKYVLLYLNISVLSSNRYLPRGSKENVPSFTITGNISMSR